MSQATKEVTKQVCPHCKMPRSEWPTPNGYDGTHCCRACAEGETCTCPHDHSKAESDSDTGSEQIKYQALSENS